MQSETFWDYLLVGGDWSVPVAAIAIGLNHFFPSYLSSIQYGGLIVVALFIYLVVNGVGASLSVAYRRIRTVQVGAQCPRCQRKLRIEQQYTCESCGEIHFDKKA